MWRVSYHGHAWYAVEFDDLEEELDNLTALVESGEVVILGDDLGTIRSTLEIEGDISIIERD